MFTITPPKTMVVATASATCKGSSVPGRIMVLLISVFVSEVLKFSFLIYGIDRKHHQSKEDVRDYLRPSACVITLI